MSLKFDEALKIVAKEILEAPKLKYQTYSQDAAEISAKMDQELISINSIFKGTVSNWDETTALYKAEVPKLHIPFLRLKMPFEVEPQRVHVLTCDCYLKTSVNHPAVENGYLNGEKLIQLFIWDLNRVLDRIPKITCSSGKMYTLRISVIQYPSGGILINIGATENYSEDDPSIMYKFIPTFLFTNKSSFFIPDRNCFLHGEDCGILAEMKETFKNVYDVGVLLQTLENQSSKISIVDLLTNLPMPLSKLGIGSVLLEAIQRCISHLQYPGPLISAYGKLLPFKQSDAVQLLELKEVFGLK